MISESLNSLCSEGWIKMLEPQLITFFSESNKNSSSCVKHKFVWGIIQFYRNHIPRNKKLILLSSVISILFTRLAIIELNFLME